MIVYINGDFVQENEVKISPYDRGFLFGDGIYEVIRTYNGRLFKMDEHLNRLAYSLKEVRINNFNVNIIKTIVDELIPRNNLSNDFAVYIQITRGVSFPRIHSFPPREIEPTVYVSTYPLISVPDEIDNGIKVILKEDIRWTRCDIKSISLLPAILANQSAKENGASEAVFVRDGFITEGSHTNFFAVKNNIIHTPPLSNLILSGITRDVIIEICKSNSFRIKEINLEEKELKHFDEFFITGTTTEVKPVIQIDNWTVKNGKPGDMTKKIQKAFFQYVSNY
ncbi:MAG: D-amino-acid transaminase [Ignavibacteriaceae bacterium]|jgi:D-alanine transaminase